MLACRRMLLVGACLWLCSAVRADIAAPDPLPVRLAGADAVVVGTVTEIEKKTVTTTRVPNDKQPVEFQVMVVKVQDALRGVKGETHVRIGFIPAGARRAAEMPAPEVNSEGVFFMKKHHKEDFYVAQPYWDIIPGKRPQFAEQVKALKDMAKLLNEPEKALESKNADERFQAASLLLLGYRGRPRAGLPRGPETEPIDAKQSKLILLALRDADWSKPFTDAQVNAQYLFGNLGLTPADGWKPAGFTDQKQFIEAAKKWLGANAETYRIKRFKP